MRLPKFSYVEAKTMEAACAILAEERHAKVLAGGTDLLVNMKNRAEAPDILVNLKRIPHLDFIRPDDGDFAIGAPGSNSNRGEVKVYYGTSSGYSLETTLSGSNTGDLFGNRIIGGMDINSDGWDDFVDCGIDSSLDLTNVGTVEAWAFLDSYDPIYRYHPNMKMHIYVLKKWIQIRIQYRYLTDRHE